MARTLKDLREQLTDEQVKDILLQFNVEPVDEDETKIIFPTCCHNLEGGSPKLYYYKNSKLFKCYTQCNELFDIFRLLVKMYKLRGRDITIKQAITICDLDATDNNVDYSYNELYDYKYMQELNNRLALGLEEEPKTYNKTLLNRYLSCEYGTESWIDEGISLDAMKVFGIKYDPLANCIVIPNFNKDGSLIGVRGRFLNPDAAAKYMPLWFGEQCLSYKVGTSFYGIYENQENIRRKRRCIIFEGEKSVLKFESIYGRSNNIALATLGKNISKNHINTLLKLGVSEVIIAYDADYEDYAGLTEKCKEYTDFAKILQPYFGVSFLLDMKNRLDYKDAPIDKGQEIFEQLLIERVII